MGSRQNKFEKADILQKSKFKCKVLYATPMRSILEDLKLYLKMLSSMKDDLNGWKSAGKWNLSYAQLSPSLSHNSITFLFPWKSC